MVMRPQLSRDSWLDEALRVLAELGHEALRAEPLAKRLGVSRGSFYWHFRDVPAFHDAVLERWETVTVDRPLERIRLPSGDRRQNELNRLIRVAFNAPVALERAVHGWAAVFAPAAERVAAVNRRRTTELASMFETAGLSSQAADASAVVLYWTYLGRVLVRDLPPNADRLNEVLARLGVDA